MIMIESILLIEYDYSILLKISTVKQYLAVQKQ